MKQSPRAWFDRFAQFIIAHKYRQCQSDHTLFVKFSSKKKIAILIVYIDDKTLTGDYEEEISSLKKALASEFQIKDLGPLRYFLGMKTTRSKKGIIISQRKYSLYLLNNPTKDQLEAMNRILRYLKMTQM